MLKAISIPLLLLELLTPALASPSPDALEVGEIVRAHPDMPERGTRMDAVRERLGAPREIKSAVGDPPITRWIYDDFIVYFEGEQVLHSVVPRKADD